MPTITRVLTADGSLNLFDIALKSPLPRQLQSGFCITEWLGTELPEVRTRHVDFLGRTAAGDLVHIESQSRNNSRMALRMAEYALAIYRRHRMFPTQVVIHVGERPLLMPTSLTGAGWACSCRIVDIRTSAHRATPRQPAPRRQRPCRAHPTRGQPCHYPSNS